MKARQRSGLRRLGGVAPVVSLALLAITVAASGRAETVLVAQHSDMAYRANSTDPGIGMAWTSPSFGDAAWARGTYGVGYDTAGAADALLQTRVPSGTASVYTRTLFTLVDASSVSALVLGADFDDAWVVWLNGVELHRANMPAGPLDWDTLPLGDSESSNGALPDYTPIIDVSLLGLPALRDGLNVLAVGVWNNGPSSDLVLVPTLIADPEPQVARGPYLQQETPTSVILRWRTNVRSDSVVRFGFTPASLLGTAADALSTTEHVVAVTGLSPSTSYYYSVGTGTSELAGGDRSYRFTTPPLPGTVKPTRVWIIGDSGTADDNARAVRDAYAAATAGKETDLWLMLGDNAYVDGTDAEYQRAVFDMYPELLRRASVWPTFGNHDSHSAASASQSGVYYDIFSLPRAGEAGGVASGTEAYYSFDHANIHFICLDSSDSSRAPAAAMATWLDLDINDTTQDWVIAFFHHGPYTKGSHDSDTETPHIEMRESILSILEAGGVDLVLSGHSHSYERSYLIDGHYGDSTSFGPGNQVDAGDGRLDGDGAYAKAGGGPLANAGAVYTVAGSSGQTESGGALDHPAMFVSFLELGSVVFVANGPRLDATFLDDAGAVLDHYTMAKATALPPLCPVRLVATAVPPTDIDVTWEDADGLEEGFELERSLDGFSYAPLATLPADTISHRDMGLAPATYWYRVRAFNSVGPSAYSNEDDASVGCSTPPGPVGNTLVLFKAGAGGTLRATWLDIAGAAAYRLYSDPVKSLPAPAFVAGAAAGSPGLSLPLPADALLYYRLRAGNACGDEGPP